MARYRAVIGIFAMTGAVGIFLAGWWLGAENAGRSPRPDATGHSAASPVPMPEAVERRVELLERELSTARRQLGEQRRILREHALSQTTRSFDEMLALLPAKYPKGDWRPAETLFEDCWFEAVDGIRLHGWYLKHPKPAAIILYAHGNAGNLTHRGAVASMLRERLNASVLLFDYRGYGRSEGVPTLEGIVRDARAARDFLASREGVAVGEVVLMGRSLGGAVAVQVAAEDGARALILESTFSSLREVAASNYPDVLVNLLVADRFDSATAIQTYDGPLLQSHGEADRTIPFSLGRELFEAANEPKVFVPIPGGGHNDRPPEEYYRHLERFVRSLPKS